jgi:hypothetical protein
VPAARIGPPAADADNPGWSLQQRSITIFNDYRQMQGKAQYAIAATHSPPLY